MEEKKTSILSILKKLSTSKREAFSIRTYWKIIISTYLFVVLLLIVGGWFCYSWAITSNSIMVRQKKQKPAISLVEIQKAEEILAGKKGRLEEVIKSKVEIVRMK